MGFFNKFGDLIIRFFSLIGALIMAIPKIPDKLRNVEGQSIKEKIDTEKIRENIAPIKEKVQTVNTARKPVVKPKAVKEEDNDVLLISAPFTSQEKENTILRLQIFSAAFIIVSILFIFRFIFDILYLIMAGAIAAYIIYLLFKKVKLMYGADFPAYRDFFLMYVAVGIILVIVGNNTNLTMAFSLQSFPSLAIFVFALLSVGAIFLIFRIRYNRDYTFGEVKEAGENTAYVKIDYDIRSNVKPDIYVVDNSVGAKAGDTVKIMVEQKLFNTSGNRPLSIIESIQKI